MKKLIFILTALPLMMVHCGEGETEEKEEKKACCSGDKKEETHKIFNADELPDESVYHLDMEWENHNGETVKLTEYGGRPVVSAMIFTNCPAACPRIVADMKNIAGELTEEQREQVQFLLISMDPENDDPERMRAFMKDFELGENWAIIRTDKNATMEMANVLGVRIKPLAEGGFDHSNSIFVFNRHGEVYMQQNGLKINPEPAVAGVRALLGEEG